MKNIILTFVLCLASLALSAKTVSFYAPKNGGTNGMVLVAAGNRQKPYWSDMGKNKMYNHAIYCYDTNTAYFIAFSFINSVSKPYTTGPTISRALYNLGYNSTTKCLMANGYTGKTSDAKGGYLAVYGTSDILKSFYFYKAIFGSWYYTGWDHYCDTVTPVSNSALAVTSGVNASGLSFDDIYPVGSIYLNVGATLPAKFTEEGRTWVRLDDGMFLMSANSTSTIAGSTGGANWKILSTANMPSHSHGGNSLTPSTAKFAGFKPNDYSDNVFSYAHWWYATSQSTAGVDYGEYTMKFYDSSTKKSYWTGATTSVGSGTAFDNRPSYLAVSMWKRTN